MLDAEEKDYEPLKASCDKLKDFINEVQGAEVVERENKSRLDTLTQEIVAETSVLINKELKKRISGIKQRIDPLVKETNELIERINTVSTAADPRDSKKLFSKRKNKQKLPG